MKSGFYFLCRRNCSGKSLLLQQLRAARKEALELLHKAPVPAEKLHPERLEHRGSSDKSQTQSCEVRQETNEVVPRKMIRLEPGKESAPFPSCEDNGADTEKENKMEAEKIQNAGDAPECPRITAELPRYPTRQVISGFGCGFSSCPGLKNIAYLGCELEQGGVWFCYLERTTILAAPAGSFRGSLSGAWHYMSYGTSDTVNWAFFFSFHSTEEEDNTVLISFRNNSTEISSAQLPRK